VPGVFAKMEIVNKYSCLACLAVLLFLDLMVLLVIRRSFALMAKLFVLMMNFFQKIPHAVQPKLGQMVQLVMLRRCALEMKTTVLLMVSFLHPRSAVQMLLFAIYLKIVMEPKLIALRIYFMILLIPISVA
jgi:hypothetical protein